MILYSILYLYYLYKFNNVKLTILYILKYTQNINECILLSSYFNVIKELRYQFFFFLSL